MRPQRHQQSLWSMFQSGPLLPPLDDTPNCWALSQLQYLEELGMEIAPAPTPLSEILLKTHSIVDNLAGITMDQQKLLTAIEIHHIEDLAVPEDRNWTPIAYTQEKLKFTNHGTNILGGPKGHHNQANDDVPIRNQRPTDSSVRRSDITPNTILLQDMEEK